jgi:hypothetical protein
LKESADIVIFGYISDYTNELNVYNSAGNAYWVADDKWTRPWGSDGNPTYKMSSSCKAKICIYNRNSNALQCVNYEGPDNNSSWHDLNITYGFYTRDLFDNSDFVHAIEDNLNHHIKSLIDLFLTFRQIVKETPLPYEYPNSLKIVRREFADDFAYLPAWEACIPLVSGFVGLGLGAVAAYNVWPPVDHGYGFAQVFVVITYALLSVIGLDIGVFGSQNICSQFVSDKDIYKKNEENNTYSSILESKNCDVMAKIQLLNSQF